MTRNETNQRKIDRYRALLAADTQEERDAIREEASEDNATTAFNDCCWCIPVKLTKANVCTRCGHQWREEKLPTTTCEWFLLCTNQTSNGVQHPILGLVPCCDRCATKLEMTDRLVPIAVPSDPAV